MNTSVHEAKLIDSATLARHMGKHVETIRRMTRDGRIPYAERVGREYRYNFTQVLEHFIKQDILHSLDNIVTDCNTPRVLRKNAESMANGLRDGSLSIDALSEVVGLSTATGPVF